MKKDINYSLDKSSCSDFCGRIVDITCIKHLFQGSICKLVRYFLALETETETVLFPWFDISVISDIINSDI